MLMEKNAIYVSDSGKLFFRNEEYRCALGKNGVKIDKVEGDGATPDGCFPLREIFYRADKLNLPRAKLKITPLSPSDGWSDDPTKPEYNQKIKLPYSGSYEKLWRDDELYDLIVVIGYNDNPIIPGKGSAIFMHIARPEFSETDGCIALRKPDLLEIIKSVDKETKICIQEN